MFQDGHLCIGFPFISGFSRVNYDQVYPDFASGNGNREIHVSKTSLGLPLNASGLIFWRNPFFLEHVNNLPENL